MSDIPTVTYYAYSGTRYVGQFSGEDSAVLAFIAGKGYTTGPKPLASDRDLWVSIVDQATAAQVAAEEAQAEIEAELAALDFSADDRAKIDSIETDADVTDTENVTAAGAVMDSEVTNLAAVKAFDPADYATAAQGAKADTAQQPPSEGAFVDGDKTKLDGIEAGATADQTGAEIKVAYEGEANTNAFTDALLSKLNSIEANADVTDTANVTAAGALMDSEVSANIKTFTLPASTTISTFGSSLVDDADAATARATLGLGTGATATIADYLAKSGGTMTGDLTVKGVIETEDTSSATSYALNPTANGTRVTHTVTATTTLTDSMSDGESITVRFIDGDSHTVNFVAGTKWVGGSAPTLTGDDLVRFEKWGADLIGYAGLGVA